MPMRMGMIWAEVGCYASLWANAYCVCEGMDASAVRKQRRRRHWEQGTQTANLIPFILEP